MARLTWCAAVLLGCGCVTVAVEPRPGPAPGLPVESLEQQALVPLAPKDAAREVTRLLSQRGVALVGGWGEAPARVLVYRGILRSEPSTRHSTWDNTIQVHARLEQVSAGTRLTLFGERIGNQAPLCSQGPRPVWVPPHECVSSFRWPSSVVEDTVKGVLFELAELGPAPR